MAALKARAAPVEKWGRVPRAAMLLEKRLDALADYCDPMLLSEADGLLAGIAVSPEPVAFAAGTHSQLAAKSRAMR